MNTQIHARANLVERNNRSASTVSTLQIIEMLIYVISEGAHCWESAEVFQRDSLKISTFFLCARSLYFPHCELNSLSARQKRWLQASMCFKYE